MSLTRLRQKLIRKLFVVGSWAVKVHSHRMCLTALRCRTRAPLVVLSLETREAVIVASTLDYGPRPVTAIRCYVLLAAITLVCVQNGQRIIMEVSTDLVTECTSISMLIKILSILGPQDLCSNDAYFWTIARIELDDFVCRSPLSRLRAPKASVAPGPIVVQVGRVLCLGWLLL